MSVSDKLTLAVTVTSAFFLSLDSLALAATPDANFFCTGSTGLVLAPDRRPFLEGTLGDALRGVNRTVDDFDFNVAGGGTLGGFGVSFTFVALL